MFIGCKYAFLFLYRHAANHRCSLYAINSCSRYPKHTLLALPVQHGVTYPEKHWQLDFTQMFKVGDIGGMKIGVCTFDDSNPITNISVTIVLK